MSQDEIKKKKEKETSTTKNSKCLMLPHRSAYCEVSGFRHLEQLEWNLRGELHLLHKMALHRLGERNDCFRHAIISARDQLRGKKSALMTTMTLKTR